MGLEAVRPDIWRLPEEGGCVKEQLWAGAAILLSSDCDPLDDSESVETHLGVHGELVAMVTIGKSTNYMVVRLAQWDETRKNDLKIEEHDKYLVLGPKAQVWLNLKTEGIASENTKDNMLNDRCLLSQGQAVQIGRASREESVGLKILCPNNEDQTVSSKHVRLICRDDGDLEIDDMYSLNGTTVLRREQSDYSLEG